MANHYVGCITEDLAKHTLQLKLSDEEKRGYLTNIAHWGSQFGAPGFQIKLFDGLLDCGFLHLFPLKEHPNYREYQAVYGPQRRNSNSCLRSQIRNGRERTIRWTAIGLASSRTGR